jgi:hypothetical protein
MKTYDFARVGINVAIAIVWISVIGGSVASVMERMPVVCVPLVISGVISHALLMGVAALFDIAEHSEAILRGTEEANLKLGALLHRQPRPVGSPIVAGADEQAALAQLIEQDRKILGR